MIPKYVLSEGETLDDAIWRRMDPDPRPDHLLSRRQLEVQAELKQWKEDDDRIEREALSENETEFDPEEAEDRMNNVRSPLQRTFRYWTPEYEARRQARKRLWSPPLTPTHPNLPLHSLQPSQRTPSPIRKRKKPSPFPPRPLNAPRNPGQLQLRLPHTVQHKVRKAKPVTSHRPVTRSMESELVALHSRRKGLVVTGSARDPGHTISFDIYIKCLP